MTRKKKPLLFTENPNALDNPRYPTRQELSDRRAFLVRLGKVGVLGAAGYLLSACDEVDDPQGRPRTIDTAPDTASDTTGPDTEYMAGIDMPDTALDTASETEVIDTEYLAGDIAPDSDTVADTEVFDTEYLAGDIAQDTETGTDTGVDSELVDTDIMAGALEK